MEDHVRFSVESSAQSFGREAIRAQAPFPVGACTASGGADTLGADASTPSVPRRGSYQIFTRCSGASHIPSPGWTSKAS